MRTMTRGWFGVAALCAIATTGLTLTSATEAAAQVCAQVKIEIVQELTLERQAFDAHMRITNGLTHLAIENLKVDVRFEDPVGNPVYATNDPNDTTALFFITLDSLSAVNAVDGTGTVAPEAVADIHWLIIPAPGAAGPDPDGTLYFVGADVSYNIGGEEQLASVTPDSIYVKPMPLLYLDYFLTPDVNGDNPYTDDVVEAPEPFTLGVRVFNDGYGPANKLAIESAQPKIIENELGLLIAFEIIGSEVGGEPATTSLTVEFGDLMPGHAAVARWFMTASLQGHFTEFDATFSHADELGGELTSLMEEVKTHWLIRDVLVDLPGRDDIRDFLADDLFGVKVYESDAVEHDVFDASADAAISSLGGDIWRMTVPGTSGLSWARVTDPTGGAKVLVQAVREDGKVLDPANAWQSSVWKKNNQPKDRYVNVFDTGNPGGLHYDLHFGALADGNDAPVLGPTPDRNVAAGDTLTYTITATDEDGTTPLLAMLPLPAGAVFIDHQDGTGELIWTPEEAQVGEYVVKAEAYDGALFDSALITLGVVEAGATNSAPEAASALIVTGKDTPSGPVTPSVVDPDPGDSHYFVLASPALHGVAEVVDNQLVYTPDSGYTGPDAFTFEAIDLFGESVVGEATVSVTGINDLIVSQLDVETTDGVPTAVAVTVENTGVEALLDPVEVVVRGTTCAADEVVGTLTTVLQPGVSSLEIPIDVGAVADDALPLVLTASVDTTNVQPEPNELNNTIARGALMPGAPSRSLALGTSGSTPTAVCALEAFTVSGRTVFGLRGAASDCYSIPAAGAQVAYELEDTGTGEIVRSGTVVADAYGAWHAEFGVPDEPGTTYELRAAVSEGSRADEQAFTLTLETCAASVPPMMVPEPAFPGPDGGDGIVSFLQTDAQFPWLVHPGMPIVTTTSGSYGATTGAGDSELVVSEGPAFGTVGAGSPAFDASLDAADLVVEPVEPGLGQRVTFRAVVTANDSFYGLPVGWTVTTPGGATATIAPSTWYYVNGDLHLAATWTPNELGDHSVQVALGPGHVDANPDDDAASADFTVVQGAPLYDGLVLWLEAGLGIGTDGDGGVHSWDDQSLAGNDASQTDAARRPTLVIDPAHGTPRVTFDGVDDHMLLPEGFEDFSDGLTAYVVVQPTNESKSSVAFEIGGDDIEDRVALGRSGTSDDVRYAIGKAAVTGTELISLASPQVLAVTHHPDHTVTLWRDGEPFDAGTIRTPSTATRTMNWIARSQVVGTPNFAGGVYAILLYDRILDEDERAAVDVYLADTFGTYHPEAAWIGAGGYSTDVGQLVHANQWTKAEADAYAAWVVAEPDAPVPGPGLEIWLRADQGLNAPGGIVQGWADGSPSPLPYDGAQVLTTARPKLAPGAIAGKAAVYFDGVDDHLVLPEGVADLDAGLTIVAVAREQSALRWASLLDLSQDDGFGRLNLSRDSEGGDGVRFASGEAMVTGDGGYASPSFRILSVVHAPTGDATIYRHGVAAATAHLGPPQDAIRDANYIGRTIYAGIGRFEGELAELLVYDRALDDAGRAQVEAYLADRFGLYHEDAAWLSDGGYGPEVLAMIAAEQWSQARADAWVAFDAAHQGDPPVPAEGLELWLAADSGVTTGAENAVGTWADKSPAGLSVLPDSAAEQPKLLDAAFAGWPAVSFDGHDDSLTLSPGELGDIDEHGLSVHAVIRSNGPPGQRPVFEIGDGTAKNQVMFGTGESSGSLRYRSGTSIVDAGLSLPAARFVTIGVVHGADGSVTLTRDGTVVATATKSLPNDTLRDIGGLAVGPLSGIALNGDIAELLVHRRGLTPGERAEVELYLADKYGLYHPQAGWIDSSGLPDEVVDLVHGGSWTLAEAQAWMDFDDAWGDGVISGVGLAMWLRADEGVTTDASGGVSTWSDLGAAVVPKDGTQQATEDRPVLVEDALNGLPVVRFDGVSDELALPPGFANFHDGLTMLAVVKPSDVNRWMGIAAFDGASAHNGRVALGRRGSSTQLRYATGLEAVDGEGVLEPEVFRLLGVVHEPDGTVTVLDRGEIAETGTASLPAMVLRDDNSIAKGVVAAGRRWAGDIAEVVVWERALDEAERADVEVHLADKYGLYHPQAGWIIGSGYDGGLIDQIHALNMNKADADAAAAGQ